MNMLRYSVTVQFDIAAGDSETLELKMGELNAVGTVTNIKAKAAGREKKDAE